MVSRLSQQGYEGKLKEIGLKSIQERRHHANGPQAAEG